MALSIKVQPAVDPRYQGVVRVELDGSLDAVTSPELERELEPVLNGDATHIVFDLARLKFISSAGLRVFGIVRKRMKAREGEASFVNMQPQIEEVFAIVKALPGLSVFANVAELDRYLAARQRKHGAEQ